MSEVTTLEFDPRAKRGELEELAIANGLVNAKTYANKPAVIEALEKVQAGGNASEIDAEYKTEETPTGDTPEDTQQNDPATTPPEPTVTDNDDEPTSDDETPENAPEPAKTSKKFVKNRNNGHAVAFDETGRPLFSR